MESVNDKMIDAVIWLSRAVVIGFILLLWLAVMWTIFTTP